MALALTIVVFFTIALVVFSFGAAAYAPSSLLGSRLRALGWQKAKAQEKPALKERLEQALDPFSKAIPLSPSDVSRTRRWLIQAGYRDTRHLTVYVGSRLATGIFALALVVATSGFNSPILMVSVGALGFFLPRFMLKRMIKARQQRIKLGLPDALDLTVICVEAGLALDQALMRVGTDLHHAHPDVPVVAVFWQIWISFALVYFVAGGDFLSGGLVAYAWYLFVHHCAHHSPGSVPASLLRHHSSHHRFANWNYGVSTTVWDRVLGTMLR